MTPKVNPVRRPDKGRYPPNVGASRAQDLWPRNYVIPRQFSKEFAQYHSITVIPEELSDGGEIYLHQNFHHDG